MWSIVTNRVAWSVCHTTEPCKNGWTDQYAIWVVGSDGPRESCVTWTGPDSPMGRVRKQLKRSWCGLDCWLGLAEGIMNLMGSSSPMIRGNFGGKGRLLKSIGTFCYELCRNSCIDQFAICVVDLSGQKEAQVQSYSPGGANVHNFNRIRQVEAQV